MGQRKHGAENTWGRENTGRRTRGGEHGAENTWGGEHVGRRKHRADNMLGGA
jgi:hypothetical protein